MAVQISERVMRSREGGLRSRQSGLRSRQSGPTLLFLAGVCLLIYIVYGYRRRGAKKQIKEIAADIGNAIDNSLRGPAEASSADGGSAPVHPNKHPRTLPLPDWTLREPRKVDTSARPLKPAVKRPHALDRPPRDPVRFTGEDTGPTDPVKSDASGLAYYFNDDPPEVIYDSSGDEVARTPSRNRDNEFPHRNPVRRGHSPAVKRPHDLSDSSLPNIAGRVDDRLLAMMKEVERVVLEDHSRDTETSFLADAVVDSRVIPLHMVEIYWFMKDTENNNEAGWTGKLADVCIDEFFAHYRLAVSDDRNLDSSPGEVRTLETHLKRWHRLIGPLWYTARAFSPRGADLYLDGSARVAFSAASSEQKYNLELVLFLPLNLTLKLDSGIMPDWITYFENTFGHIHELRNERGVRVKDFSPPDHIWYSYAMRWLLRNGMDIGNVDDRRIVFRPAWPPSKTNFNSEAEGTTSEIPFQRRIVEVDSAVVANMRERSLRGDRRARLYKVAEAFNHLAGLAKPSVVWFSNHRQHAWDVSTVVTDGPEQNCRFEKVDLELLLMMCGPAVNFHGGELHFDQKGEYEKGRMKQHRGTTVPRIDLGGMLPQERGQQKFVDLDKLFPFLDELYLPFIEDDNNTATPASSKIVVYPSWGVTHRLMAKDNGLTLVFRSLHRSDAEKLSRNLKRAIDDEKQRHPDPEAWANDLRRIIKRRVLFECRVIEGRPHWQWMSFTV
ncbi:hypothetical protein BCR39DRAFT_559866 [Naematelia encephala]|uniref:Uncharacterized protein n=1 Tax=Naematelia encephala TaxID=71784 RepID=A0A1Y2AZ62_9TREE|nr:hypothetical protein BCR39DRAFT_559866 [Naematelia encephala]